MLTKPRCLIVDDEPDISELLSITIEKMGIKTDCASTLEDARFCLSRTHYDLCLTDMRLPDGNGLDLMKHINLHHSGLPIAVMTAFGSADNAVSALKAGAFDYLNKPISLQELRPLISSAIKPNQHTVGGDSKISFIGNSDAIHQARELIHEISQSQANALISGEPGTGKELAARLIHFNSTRREQNFVKVNCASITEKNVEMHFFGIQKNAEHVPKKTKVGFFEAATNGTLFLDQIDKLPLAAQTILEEAIQINKGNIRVICSTHQDLKGLADEGFFDHDFYYQLSVLSLHMPALRNLQEDIPAIAQHLLKKITWPAENAPMLSGCALSKLKACPFEGNVTELESVLQRAVALHQPQIIKAEHLAVKEKNLSLTNISIEASDIPLPDYLEHVERQAILKALDKTRQNKTAAAKLLGVSFRTLRYRISKLGLSKKT